MSIREYFLRRIALKLKRYVPAEPSLEEKCQHLEQLTHYLEHQVSSLSSIMRYVAVAVVRDLQLARQTHESFDFQWDRLPQGRYMLENEQFRKEATGYVSEYTTMPTEWFAGKKVADVGCGLGRYSWALCKLGASVLSIDQSEYGLRRTLEACKDFPDHRILQADLLEPLTVGETFDLVWCYGVLHHTGDTYRAFKNIAPLVKLDGYLFLMIYGEPRWGITSDYTAVNEYEDWRRQTRNLNLHGKLDAIKKGMNEKRFSVIGEEHVHGYFDAIAPAINDLYTWEEVEGWLLEAGFHSIQRTIDTRNHHVIAQKG